MSKGLAHCVKSSGALICNGMGFLEFDSVFEDKLLRWKCFVISVSLFSEILGQCLLLNAA